MFTPHPTQPNVYLVNGGVYVVNGTLTIDAEVRITNGAVFYFRKNAGVLVQAAGRLIMDDVTFDASARPINDVSCLWNGIVLEAGGSLNRLISTNSLIKFAKIGVLSKEGGARYRLVETHFLDNVVGLQVEKYQAGVQHPGIYKGCVFEIDSLNLSDPTYGVRVWDNDNIRFGDLNCTDSMDLFYSKFINLDYGIWGRRTSARVLMNRFYNIKEAGIRIVGHEIQELEDPTTGQLIDYVEQWVVGDTMSFSYYYPKGTCYEVGFNALIQELSLSGNCIQTDRLMGNTFQNCKNGVWSTASTRIWMRQNFFENSEEYAVTVEGSKKNSSWEAMHNYVRGCENGFRGYNNFNMRMEIDTNCFETPLVGGVPMNEEQFLVRTAVHISQTLYPPVGIKNTTRISDNTINRYPTAVSVSTRRNVFVERNEMRVPKYSLFQGSTYGVRLTNVQGDTLRCNRIVVEGTQDVSGYTNGIALTASPHSLVEENKMEYVSNSLVAESGNFDSHIWTNEFRGFQKGVYMKGANSVVGRQFRTIPGAIVPQDNEFLEIPTTTSNPQLACFYTESNLQPPSGQSFDWDLRTPVGTVYYPIALSQGFYYHVSGPQSASMNLVNNAPHLFYTVCDFVPNPPEPPLKQIDSIAGLSDSTRLYLLESVVEASNPLNYVVLDDLADQMLDRNSESVYRSLVEWNRDLSTFPILDSIENVHNGAVVEDLFWTDVELSTQLDSAGVDVSLVVPNVTEPSHQRYLRFLAIEDRILWDSTGVFPYTTAEADSLVSWAELCPDLFGAFVYRARSVCEFWKLDYNSCVLPSQMAMKGIAYSSGHSHSGAKCALLLYPNPTENMVFISGCSDEDGFIRVFDSWGQLKHKSEKIVGQETALNMKDWPSGVYIVQWVGSSGESVSTRVSKE